ncbi:hypothetical protein [Microvirga makkahensis]|uniref:Uncharacterized protein n=1 Tax=Microvirga makkahensis TaxID=1128670 RepID=A0A7X3MT20_9HYPH|nr:hypothetical protein [Microvirga makkahensis]MXQ12538.1 hypothetical protein [Microvirga makkahensis]
MNQLEREMDRFAKEGTLRLGRAAVYAAVAYLLLWTQSVYEGSYLLVALVVLLLAMTRRSLVLIQVLLGILFVVGLLSEQINTVVGAVI